MSRADDARGTVIDIDRESSTIDVIRRLLTMGMTAPEEYNGMKLFQETFLLLLRTIE